MQFQDADIEKLAMLSRITLTPRDRDAFRDQLTSVLQYVEQVSTIEIKKPGVTKDDHHVLRLDEVREPLATPKEMLSSSPNTKEGRISVLSVQ